MNIPVDLRCCSDCTFQKSTVSLVQKLPSWGDDRTSCPFQEICELRILRKKPVVSLHATGLISVVTRYQNNVIGFLSRGKPPCETY